MMFVSYFQSLWMFRVAHQTAKKAKAPKPVVKLYEAVNSQSTYRYLLFCPREKTFP